MSSFLLRVSAENFPTPTALSVEWPEAGVVFFVDVCRSHYDLSSPSVWILDPPQVPQNGDDEDDEEKASPRTTKAEICTLHVSPSSTTFRCSYFVPKIINNVLVLFSGDTYAAPTTTVSPERSLHHHHHHHHTPFFGVCASLLPPPELVRQHGVDAFASFSFTWLCGPDVRSMRPAARVGFACTVVEVKVDSIEEEDDNNQQQPKHNASIWIHGGIPLVNNNNNQRKSQSSVYEPLAIVPSNQVLELEQQQQQQDDDDDDVFILAKNVDNDNNNNAERYFRKAVSEDFYGMFELKLFLVGDQDEGKEGAVSVWPWIRHPGLPIVCHHSLCSVTTRTTKEKTHLVVFGGLRLDCFRSARSDLLPPFRRTEFNISNAFYVYDIENEDWDWQDSLMTLTTTCGAKARPPPVFNHKLVEIIHDRPPCAAKTFIICGGLRGRFSERSKEIWSFCSNDNNCSQRTGPPTSSHDQVFFSLFERLWVADLKSKKLWSQRSNDPNHPWEGPFPVVSSMTKSNQKNANENDKNNNFQKPPPTVVHISNVVAVGGSSPSPGTNAFVIDAFEF